MRHLNFLPGLLAVALAGASVYFAQQLTSERGRARQAETRVAELQSRLDNAYRQRLSAREATPRVSSVAPQAPKRSQVPDNAGAAAGTLLYVGDLQSRADACRSDRAIQIPIPRAGARARDDRG